MTTGGQLLLQTGQAGPQPFAAVPRPLVGFARNYPAGWYNRQHTHPWAQVIYAVTGVMRIETRSAAYVVPPSTALFLPADVPHAVRMDGPVAMRALFLREDATARSPAQAGVISVSPLLREVILAACSEPLRWDLRGRGRHWTRSPMPRRCRSACRCRAMRGCSGWFRSSLTSLEPGAAWKISPGWLARPAAPLPGCSEAKPASASGNGASRCA